MDYRNYKKGIWNILTIVIIFILLFWVFHKDYYAILECMKNVSTSSLFLILGLGICYQLLDSAACFALLRSQLSSFKYRQAVEITFLGVFGSVATFATGIIPIQSYYLYRRGMPVGSGVGTLILKYIFHKSAIFFYAVFMIIMQGNWLKESSPGLMKYIYTGFAICTVIILMLILLCTWEKVQQFLKKVIERLPNTEKWRQRKNAWGQNLEELYRESKKIFKNHACCRKVVLFNLLKLFFLYTIPFCCIRALNIQNLQFKRVQMLSSIMFLIIGTLPNVAGIGPTEFAFLMLFIPFVGRVKASSALVLYRMATYFLPFLLSVVMFLKVKKYMETEVS